MSSCSSARDSVFLLARGLWDSLQLWHEHLLTQSRKKHSLAFWVRCCSETASSKGVFAGKIHRLASPTSAAAFLCLFYGDEMSKADISQPKGLECIPKVSRSEIFLAGTVGATRRVERPTMARENPRRPFPRIRVRPPT